MIICHILDSHSALKKVHFKNIPTTSYSQLWIDITDPQKQDFEFIRTFFSLHSLTVEDCLKPDSPIKIEVFDGYNFLVMKGIRLEEEQLAFQETDIIQGKNILITAHLGPNRFIEQLMKNTDHITSLMKRGSDFLLHFIIDHEVDNYFPVLDVFDEQVDEIEEEIFHHSEKQTLNDILMMRRQLFKIRTRIVALKDVVGHLSKKDVPFISARAEAYFRDVYDHLHAVTDMTERYRANLSSALQVHLSLNTHKMNEIMKVLTIITTIGMPLTVITSIYGMNFAHMPELDWKYGYPIVLLTMLVISGIMLTYFKKKDWM